MQHLGASRSFMAVPSAKNSGLLSTWNLTPLSVDDSTALMACAVFTGTVDFSTCSSSSSSHDSQPPCKVAGGQLPEKGEGGRADVEYL